MRERVVREALAGRMHLARALVSHVTRELRDLRSMHEPATSPGFTADTRRQDGVAVIEVAGDLDVATAPALRRLVQTQIEEGEGPLVVDFTRATLAGSLTLHLLLGAQRRLARQDRRLVVVAPPGPVLRVIESARLVGTLEVVADRAAALSAVRDSPRSESSSQGAR